ncbi:BON domain-containing protein [Methylibium sp.]|uniref:BON domain-containing protein n=1 Tax=Methylibium sp. TaxID=2067992 RepID=UPI00286AF626|nr:BON domain-containing protein [Methylibium sp.]
MNMQRRFALPVAAVVLATMSLVACNRNESASVERSAERAADSTREAARDTANATKDAAKVMGEKVADAVITTSINAELAKDTTLSALKINVDTRDGKVMLRGTAPDATARDRATKLASGVKGVTSVDNQLTVAAAKS